MRENINKINKLFKELYDVTGIGDINFHRFNKGSLDPIHIMETELMGAERWRSTHRELKLKIDGDPVLDEIVKGKPVYIYDIPNYKNSSPAFARFGIKSLLVYPLFNYEDMLGEVIGLICIPALDKKTKLSKDKIDRCGKIVEEFNKTYEFI